MTDPTGPYWTTDALPERSTIPAPRPVPGCSVCGAADCATVDGVHGRRCSAHPPGYDADHLARLVVDGLGVRSYARTVATLPPGVFRREFAEHLVDLGHGGAALAYLKCWMAAEIGRRFAAVRVL